MDISGNLFAPPLNQDVGLSYLQSGMMFPMGCGYGYGYGCGMYSPYGIRMGVTPIKDDKFVRVQQKKTEAKSAAKKVWTAIGIIVGLLVLPSLIKYAKPYLKAGWGHLKSGCKKVYNFIKKGITKIVNGIKGLFPSSSTTPTPPATP